MGYRDEQPYLYGKLNKEVENNTYSGEDTDTAQTQVDNDTSTIRVNVKDSIILDKATINENNEMIFTARDGTQLAEVDLNTFQQEQSDLAEEDVSSETFVKNKSTKYLKNEGEDGSSKYTTEKEVEAKWDEFNLANGEGQGSLVQKNVKSSSGESYTNIASGSGAVALGKNTQALGNTDFVIGQSNKTTAESSGNLVSGNSNTVDGQYNLVSGNSNTVDGFGSAVSGNNNSVDPRRCAVVGGISNAAHNDATALFGRHLDSTTENQLIAGSWNKLDSNGTFIVAGGTGNGDRQNALDVNKSTDGDKVFYNQSADYNKWTELNTPLSITGSLVAGNRNEAKGSDSFAFGRDNKANTDFSTAIGVGVETSNANEVAIGRYNEKRTDGRARFTIGGGSEDVRSNIFQVLDNGAAIAKGAPEGEFGVVRQKELDTKLDKSSTAGLYAVASDGHQYQQSLAASATGVNAVPVRDSNGYLYTQSPNEYADNTKYSVVNWNTFKTASDLVASKLNENIIKNPEKTYLVWKGENADFKLRKSIGMVIDWGDGSADTFSAASEVESVSHTYTDTIGIHLISISNLAHISSASFQNKTELLRISIGKSDNPGIGSRAFAGCTNLTQIDIPDTVDSIGDYAFDHCTALEYIKLPKQLERLYVSVFYYCSALKEIILPDTVTDIGTATFSGCTKLERIHFNGKTNIAADSFKACEALKEIVIDSVEPAVLNAVIHSNTQRIVVPKESIRAYKNAEGWKQYADRIVYNLDSSYIDNFGLTQGDKKYSIVQKRVAGATIDSGTPAPDELCKAYQWGSSSFGGACQSGMTEDEFNAFYWDSSTQTAKNGGQGLKDGKVTDYTGRTYDKSRNYAFSVGGGNKALGRDSFAAGNSNITEALASAVFGFNNKVSNIQKYSFTVGRYNEDKANLLFSVGNGIDDSNRRNAFEIDTDGNVRTYRYPLTENDVTNRGYVNNVQETLQTQINSRVQNNGNPFRVYVTDQNGNNSSLVYGNTYTLGTNSFPIYSSHGTLKVANSETDNEAVNQGQLKTKLDKAGGTITGDLIIAGDLTVNGTEKINNVENLNVKDAMIYSNADGATLASLAGLGIKTNATDIYGIVYDYTSDSVKLGLGKADSNGKFTFNTDEGTAVATRDDSTKLTNGCLLAWDATNNKLVDSNFGLTAGDALYSIVQKRINSAGEVVATKAYQRGSMSIGGGTVAGDKDGVQTDSSFAFSQGELSNAIARATSAFNNSNATAEYAFSANKSNASGVQSASFNQGTASGELSFAAGDGSLASGKGSFAVGQGVKASADYMFAIGKFNANYNDSLFEVGYGTQGEEKTALAVNSIGDVTVTKAPRTEMAVVRKTDLDSAVRTLNNSLLIKIGEKLDKPANPLEESVITMASTGTVGTLRKSYLVDTYSDQTIAGNKSFESLINANDGITLGNDSRLTFNHDTMRTIIVPDTSYATEEYSQFIQTLPQQKGTFLLRPDDLPTETSLVTVSSTGTHAYKKVSELVDTTSEQTINGTKTFGIYLESFPTPPTGQYFSHGLKLEDETYPLKMQNLYSLNVEGLEKVTDYVETWFNATNIKFSRPGGVQYNIEYPVFNSSNSFMFALTPYAAPTEPSVVVNAVDRTPTWKPVSELGGNALKVTVW